MSYIKIRFGNAFEHKKCHSEKSIDEMFQAINPMFHMGVTSWKPQVDIFETKIDVVIQVTMAGVDKENLQIEISEKAVKIYGERTGNPKNAEATYRLAEIQYGRFERVLFLPCIIDTEKVSASYENGFLQVSLAKLPE